MDGVTVLLSGNFWQMLPIIPRDTHANEVNEFMKSSHLWSYVQTLKLITNMRVQKSGDIDSQKFAVLLLKLEISQRPMRRLSYRGNWETR